ncbi:MKC7 (YDR144C) and YPS1 (YLR120C) [Zygosaccharomyces parabailii]|nr:MKC7 (YDR144C) and YPS1 (YLR120C) [Zygosaccharomyces parabailii]CDH14200.1 related to Aspartic proteinase 3 [Zygosaccharomyces bailii ISA1307]
MKNSLFLTTLSALSALVAGSSTGSSSSTSATPSADSVAPIKLAFEKSHGSSYEKSTHERGDVEANVTNQQTFYSVQLAVGSPGQNITVLLDTGSSDLWVTGKGNPYCKSNSKSKSKTKSKTQSKTQSKNKRDELQSLLSLLSALEPTTTLEPTGSVSGSDIPYWSWSGIPTGSGSGSAAPAVSVTPTATMDCSLGTFDTSKSKSFKSNHTSFYITYGDLSFASGIWGTDHIGLGNVTLANVSFAVANKTNSSVGVLGLGLPEDESTYSTDSSQKSSSRYEYYNFPSVLKQNGLIQKTVFSLYLNSSNSSYGNILFGAVDHSKYSGQLYTVPLLNPDTKSYPHPVEFDVTLHGVGFTNGTSKSTFTTTPIPALLDSGTTLMYLPSELAEQIADKLGGQYDDDIGYFMIPCPSDDDDSKLVYDFGGFEIATNLSNYVLQSSDTSYAEDTQCVLGILPSDVEAILGDVFLVDAYVVYNLEDYEISLAQASYDNKKEDIELVTSKVPSATKAPGYSSTWSAQSYSTGGNMFTTTSKR